MKLFAKLTFICNVGFLVFLALQYVEIVTRKNKPAGSIIPLPFVVGTLVVLGQLAIFINLVFCLAVLLKKISKKELPNPRWIVASNAVLLLVQLFYFFIY